MIFNPRVVKLTGSRIPLLPPSNFTATPGNSQVSLTWTDPGDETSGGQIVAKWEFTRIVRKVGSLPANQNDGTIVVESTQKNQYLSAPYVDTGLTNDTTYYYGAFACSTAGVWSDGAFVSAIPVAGTPLGELAEGTLINIQESGQPVQFYVAKVGYEPALNGPNRVLMVRKDVHSDRAWNSSGINFWKHCTMRTWLNNAYKKTLSSNVQNLINTTSYYYTPGNGISTVTTRSDAVFLLSLTELGKTASDANVEGLSLPIFNILQIAYQGGAATTQWTRSPYRRGTTYVYRLDRNGLAENSQISASSREGARPCFTLPTNALVDSDLNLVESYDPPPIDTPLGDLAEGTLITINESGSPVEFYVTCQNYEQDLNGAGRVLMVRKDVYDQRQWNSTNVNAWATSTMLSWLNGDYKGLFSANVQQLIGKTTYEYTPGDGNWTVTTRSDSVFSMSMTELGISGSYINEEGAALPIASVLKIAYLNGNANSQWSRSVPTNNTGSAYLLTQYGGKDAIACATSQGTRPCFTLPSTALVYQNLALIEEVPNA